MPNNKIRVAILCGGVSGEREVSLRSGEQVFKHLDSLRFDKSLIEIAEDGRWFLEGAVLYDPRQGASEDLTRLFDVVFLALHGAFGEDGKIQALLELFGIPYTGSGVLASSLCMHKAQTHHFVSGIGVTNPRFFTVFKDALSDLEALNERIQKEIGYPCIVKPNASGSSIGITLVRSKDALSSALDLASENDDIVLVEEYIKGRELTCGVLGNASVGGDVSALPPVEILSQNDFFDYEAKYESGKTREVCPASLSEEETKMIKDFAVKIHVAIGCDGLSRTDFILKDGIFYFLETNTIPGLTEQSLCPKEAEAMGLSFGDFLAKQVELALEKGRSGDL